MKRIIIITLCLCLLLCGCAPSFSAANGPVIDREFIETFPFESSALTAAVDWFEKHDKYKIDKERTDSTSIYANYRGNVDWEVYVTNNDYQYDCVALFYYYEDYSEQDVQSIFSCAVAELTDLCSAPVYTSDDGSSMTFYYGNLEINITCGVAVTLKMIYWA